MAGKRAESLENCISRALILGDRERIDVADLPPSLLAACGSGTSRKIRRSKAGPSSTTGLEELERLTIARVFEQVGGDKAMAGKMLGISRATLYRKLKRYQISGATQRQSGIRRNRLIVRAIFAILINTLRQIL